VHLVEAKGRPAVAPLEALATLDLPDRVEDASVGLGFSSAAE
jgi:hypothetical protein